MSESVYVLLAVALVVSYLLLTSGGGSTTIRSRTEEIEQVIRRSERDIDAIYDHGKGRIDEAVRRK
jgi:hypothetical protein